MPTVTFAYHQLAGDVFTVAIPQPIRRWLAKQTTCTANNLFMLLGCSGADDGDWTPLRKSSDTIDAYAFRAVVNDLAIWK